MDDSKLVIDPDKDCIFDALYGEHAKYARDPLFQERLTWLCERLDVPLTNSYGIAYDAMWITIGVQLALSAPEFAPDYKYRELTKRPKGRPAGRTWRPEDRKIAKEIIEDAKRLGVSVQKRGFIKRRVEKAETSGRLSVTKESTTNVKRIRALVQDICEARARYLADALLNWPNNKLMAPPPVSEQK